MASIIYIYERGKRYYVQKEVEEGKNVQKLQLKDERWCGMSFYYAPRPAEQSEAGRGAFNFSHIQIYTRLLQGELFKVTMYTAHIGSNGSHFLTAMVLVYWTLTCSRKDAFFDFQFTKPGS